MTIEDKNFWKNIEYVKTYCKILGLNDKMCEQYKYLVQNILINNDIEFFVFEDEFKKQVKRKIKLNEIEGKKNS